MKLHMMINHHTQQSEHESAHLKQILKSASSDNRFDNYEAKVFSAVSKSVFQPMGFFLPMTANFWQETAPPVLILGTGCFFMLFSLSVSLIWTIKVPWFIGNSCCSLNIGMIGFLKLASLTLSPIIFTLLLIIKSIDLCHESLQSNRSVQTHLHGMCLGWFYGFITILFSHRVFAWKCFSLLNSDYKSPILNVRSGRHTLPNHWICPIFARICDSSSEVNLFTPLVSLECKYSILSALVPSNFTSSDPSPTVMRYIPQNFKFLIVSSFKFASFKP